MTRKELEHKCEEWLRGNHLPLANEFYLTNFVERLLHDEFSIDLERPKKTDKPGGGNG